MEGAFPDPGSFRDPDGGILHCGEQVFRYFTAQGAAKFSALQEAGLIDRLVGESRLIEVLPVEPGVAKDFSSAFPEASLFIEHPRLPFVSYCYEWPFEMLKAAALHYLEILLVALDSGYILKDAPPYNTQFRGPHPLLIDVSSFEEYRPGQPWDGYSQFCRLFLNPLLLQSLTGVRFQAWLRGSLEGIEPADLSRLLSWRQKFRPRFFPHVVLQAWLERRFGRSLDLSKDNVQPGISGKGLRSLISKLGNTISALSYRGGGSAWLGYESDNFYDAEDQTSKDAFVQRAIQKNNPTNFWDLGCNTGRYSLEAAKHARHVVAFDRDPDTLDQLHRRATSNGANVLPLVMDLLDPSPEQGWGQVERRGMIQRGPADMVLALALSHHIAVSGNVPLTSLMEWLSRVTKTGVIEFVPKEDPALKVLLRWREDIYHGYSSSHFEDALKKYFRITERCHLPKSGRVLYSFSRSGD